MLRADAWLAAALSRNLQTATLLMVLYLGVACVVVALALSL
ncbi:MAG: hypothetical protein ACM30I_02140 [Gemmatimonas sp.]